MFWKKWSRQKTIAVLAAAAALVILIAAVCPAWRHFVDEDNAATCYDARYWVGVRYRMAIRSALEEGAEEAELDYEELLREAVEDNFTFDLAEDLTSDNLCRGGGTCTFTIDEETHSLSIDCDREGHVHADDLDVTEELMDSVTW